jgi:hypothetical protein
MQEVFKSFFSEEEGKQYADLLFKHDITFTLERSHTHIDKIIIGEDMAREVLLKLDPVDFERANQIIDAEIEKKLSDIDKDYYLYTFTETELKEVLQKPDEWNNQDVLLARKILNDHGANISAEDVKTLRTERIRELETPETERTSKLWPGYLLAILVPIVGVFYSSFNLTLNRVLPDGQKVWVYDQKSRRHFRVMFAISLFEILLAFGRIFIIVLDQAT